MAVLKISQVINGSAGDLIECVIGEICLMCGNQYIGKRHEPEYLIIKNKGDTKFSLQDWSLRGSEQKSIPIESDIMLNPGGSLKIYSKEGTDSALTLYLNSQQAYWKSGITVTLRDPNQVERARYEIP